MLSQTTSPTREHTAQHRAHSYESQTIDATVPPVPKTLNHALSELAYFSTQSQSTDMSQGCGSVERPSYNNNSQLKPVGKYFMLQSPNKGSSRLFKNNNNLCPPIGPKTLFSPVMVSEKTFQSL